MSVTREKAAHSGISGSYHHYGHLCWWSPENLHKSDYARPECPVTQLAHCDEKEECRIIGERVTADDGRGAWRCSFHGTFRVFGYPRGPSTASEQTTLGDV